MLGDTIFIIDGEDAEDERWDSSVDIAANSALLSVSGNSGVLAINC